MNDRHAAAIMGIEESMFTAAYNEHLESAREEGRGRTTIAFGVGTLSLLILGWYYNLSLHPEIAGNDVLLDFVPSAGLFLCFVLMTIEGHRYASEVRYTDEAVAFEEKGGLGLPGTHALKGAAAIRAEALALHWSSLPPRGHIAGMCFSIAWSIIAVIRFWI